MALPLNDRSGEGPDAVIPAGAEKEAKAAADTKTSRRDRGIAISVSFL
jgi:hypothetical protein